MDTNEDRQFNIDMALAASRAGMQIQGADGKDIVLATIESLLANHESEDCERHFWDLVKMLDENYGLKPGKMSEAAKHAMEALGTFERERGKN